MANRPCTHTSDWWKEMLPCLVCGAPYSDEEALAIANKSEQELATWLANRVSRVTGSRIEAVRP